MPLGFRCFYLPIKFDDMIYNNDIAGGIIWPGEMLIAEHLAIAPLMAIPTENSSISKDTATEPRETPYEHPFQRERITRAQCSLLLKPESIPVLPRYRIVPPEFPDIVIRPRSQYSCESDT